MGYEDPINPNYEATSDMYHRCLAECMERMRDAKALGDGSEKRVGIMVASHNADTIRFAIEKMKEYDIKVTFVMFISRNWWYTHVLTTRHRIVTLFCYVHLFIARSLSLS